ncbi:MAG: SUMF1/EgtB/PvdO family nonheme iron enzyme [Planctomycetia bacterium]|nr:SUMF1/EgtB/PvdO family nonheme iron enzyme [Planctomycetia bacterium]
MKHLLFLLLFGVSSVAIAQNRGMELVPKENRFALLIGVNEYQKPIQSLRFCESDIDLLEKTLREIGVEHIVKMTTSATKSRYLPTKENILRQVERITGLAEAGSQVIIAFSGHGVTMNGKAYLCPMDANVKKSDSFVSRDTIFNLLSECPATQKLCFIDACRDEFMVEGAKSISGMKGLNPAEITDPGFVLISSCAKGEQSWEHPQLKNGVFTYFLVEGLTGAAAQDGEVTMMSLFSYVNRKTKFYVDEHFEVLQRPQIRFNQQEVGDFVLARVDSTIPKPVLPISSDPTAGERMVKTINGVEYAFRWCPAGSFMMGSPEGELGRYNDETQHRVTLTKGFWMLETEVTQEMWVAVMGDNPSWFSSTGIGKDKVSGMNTDNFPVENVSWDDCQEFCQKLRSQGLNVQLPTEAQWEYACRAGTTTGLNNGKDITSETVSCYNLDEVGWYEENSDSTTHVVGQKKPNAWGLYDMHGNVLEWCADWYGKDSYAKSPTSDPTGPASGSLRVSRGGSWSDDAKLCRSAFRRGSTPTFRRYRLGFRPVLVP